MILFIGPYVVQDDFEFTMLTGTLQISTRHNYELIHYCLTNTFFQALLTDAEGHTQWHNPSCFVPEPVNLGELDTMDMFTIKFYVESPEVIRHRQRQQAEWDRIQDEISKKCLLKENRWIWADCPFKYICGHSPPCNKESEEIEDDEEYDYE